MPRPWVYLIIAGLLECVWAIGLKQSHGFTRPLPSAITVAGLAGSMYLLALAMRSMPVGTAYAVWTGIGATGAAIIGIVFLKESRDFWRLISLGCIVAGIVGLKLTSRG
jgi:quaternary ammonium compound-resistance protein SugE